MKVKKDFREAMNVTSDTKGEMALRKLLNDMGLQVVSQWPITWSVPADELKAEGGIADFLIIGHPYSTYCRVQGPHHKKQHQIDKDDWQEQQILANKLHCLSVESEVIKRRPEEVKKTVQWLRAQTTPTSITIEDTK